MEKNLRTVCRGFRDYFIVLIQKITQAFHCNITYNIQCIRICGHDNSLNFKDASGFFYMSVLLFLNHARKPYFTI
jgi:hypothetical protein